MYHDITPPYHISFPLKTLIDPPPPFLKQSFSNFREVQNYQGNLNGRFLKTDFWGSEKFCFSWSRRMCFIKDSWILLQQVQGLHLEKTSVFRERSYFLSLMDEVPKYHHSKVTSWRRKWQPTPVFLPGKIHGQRSLAGWSPWDSMTEHVCTRVEGDGLVAINW